MIKFANRVLILAAALSSACTVERVILSANPETGEAQTAQFSRQLRERALELAVAGDYDEQLCMTAQRVILNAMGDEFTILVQRGQGNGFHTIQMGIVPRARIVRIAMTTVADPSLDIDTYVACKMVDRDRVNDELDLNLRGRASSCRNVNELTYATALDSLSADERDRFLSFGKPLRFVDDYVTAGGGEWLPLKIDEFVRDAEGAYIEIQAPAVAVPWNRGERVFYQGTQHCKLITLAAMRRWMTDGGLRQASNLFPPSAGRCAGPSVAGPNVGSCRFFFAPANASFCQDYTGGGWTANAARDECAKRHASAQALQAADNTYEGRGGIYSELTCGSRDDVSPIVGTCVFNCASDDESLWQVSDADAINETITRACDLFIRREGAATGDG